MNYEEAWNVLALDLSTQILALRRDVDNALARFEGTNYQDYNQFARLLQNRARLSALLRVQSRMITIVQLQKGIDEQLETSEEGPAEVQAPPPLAEASELRIGRLRVVRETTA